MIITVFKKLTYIFLFVAFATGCKRTSEKERQQIVVKYALEYVIGLDRLPQVYKSRPLIIINPGFLDSLSVNGQKCVLLPQGTSSSTILKGMDLFNPIPLVEVGIIKFKDRGIVDIELIFRATGHVFYLNLDYNRTFKKYDVLKLRESTI